MKRRGEGGARDRETHVCLHVLPSPVLFSKLFSLLRDDFSKVVVGSLSTIRGSSKESHHVVDIRVILLDGDVVDPRCDPVLHPFGKDTGLEDHTTGHEQSVESRAPSVAIDVQYVCRHGQKS